MGKVLNDQFYHKTISPIVLPNVKYANKAPDKFSLEGKKGELKAIYVGNKSLVLLCILRNTLPPVHYSLYFSVTVGTTAEIILRKRILRLHFSRASVV